MRLIDTLKILRGEALDEKKKSKGKKIVTSRKSRMPIYATIKQALAKTKAGTIFSTKGSKRTYVTTQGGWGKDKSQRVSGRTAKGFTPGSSTPGSSWKSIRSHAARTRTKHKTGTGSGLTGAARRRKDKGK